MSLLLILKNDLELSHRHKQNALQHKTLNYILHKHNYR